MTQGTRGMLWMVGAALFFSASVGYVRYLSEFMNTFEVVFIRQVMGLAFMLPWLARAGMSAVRTSRMRMQIFRAVLSYLGMLTSYYSFTLIPIADAMALQFATPMFTTVLAIVFLKEVVGLHRWAAIFFGFVGVLIIIRPGFTDLNLGVPMSLLAAAFYAGQNVANRALSRTDSTAVILFYGFVLQIPMALIPAAANWVTPGWDIVPALLAFGVVAIAAQWCLTKSLAVAEASLVEPVMFLRLPFVSGIGYMFFAQIPDGWTWAGAVLIFVSTYELARREAAQARRRQAARPPPAPGGSG